MTRPDQTWLAVLVVDMQNEFLEAGGLRSRQPEDQCREGTWSAEICEVLAPVEGDMPKPG